MKSLIQFCFILFPLVLLSTARADEAAIKKSLSSFMPQAGIDSIKPSEVDGVYEVKTGSEILYVSGNGKYILQGQLIDIEAKKNITETKKADLRKAALEKVGPDKMIVFEPKTSKHTVSVFTDIDCGYCRKLHSEIDQYLAQNITVRYLFFPRAGKGSESYKKAISVWCAADRQKALTAAKKNEPLEQKNCDNPIDQHMALGEDFGMSGTPMIVTEKGNILPGYVPAPQLAGVLSKE
jgi:thiol:disulfide interchange protein DsbC